MRRITVSTLLALVTGAALVVTASPAAADCLALTDEESTDLIDAVFFGRIEAIRADADADLWLVRVESVVKGDVDTWTSIGVEDGDGGLDLPIGEPIVVFGETGRQVSGVFATNNCLRTRVVGDESILVDAPRTDPNPGGEELFSAFGIGSVVDAPEPIEEASTANPVEEPVEDDGEVEISERDQAELDAAADPADAALVDEPDDGPATATVLIGILVALAAIVLIVELRRSRPV